MSFICKKKRPTQIKLILFFILYMTLAPILMFFRLFPKIENIGEKMYHFMKFLPIFQVTSSVFYSQRMLDYSHTFRTITDHGLVGELDTDIWSDINGGIDVKMSFWYIAIWWSVLFLICEGYCCFCLWGKIRKLRQFCSKKTKNGKTTTKTKTFDKISKV